MQQRKGWVADETRWYELPKYVHDPNKTFMENWREHVKRKKQTGASAICAQVIITHIYSKTSHKRTC